MDDIVKVVETTQDLTEPVTVGVEAYVSEDYARAERDKLWRKVWQQVGRLEEIPEDAVDHLFVGIQLGVGTLEERFRIGNAQDRLLSSSWEGDEGHERPGDEDRGFHARILRVARRAVKR